MDDTLPPPGFDYTDNVNQSHEPLDREDAIDDTSFNFDDFLDPEMFLIPASRSALPSDSPLDIPQPANHIDNITEPVAAAPTSSTSAHGSTARHGLSEHL